MTLCNCPCHPERLTREWGAVPGVRAWGLRMQVKPEPCGCSWCRPHPTLSEQLYRDTSGCATRAAVLALALWWVA